MKKIKSFLDKNEYYITVILLGLITVIMYVFKEYTAAMIGLLILELKSLFRNIEIKTEIE